MKFLLTRSIVLLFALSCSTAFSQTPGLIFKQATSAQGRAVMDPNGDGYVSAASTGFTGTDYGTQSEISMIALPIISSEPMSDLTTGSNGGLTDIVSFGNTKNSVFVLKRTISSGTYAGDYFIVRFRVGKNGSAGKGYSILIDVDGTSFGTQYQATNSSNPGYEKELVLQTGSQPKVVIYNYSNTGAQSVGSEYANGNDYHQRSVALSTNGGDADYFYDFYVPFSFLGLTTQPVRLVATTVTNSVSAISGVKSDFNGINDKIYSNNPVTLQNVLIAAFPATPLNALSEGGAFNLTATTAPVLSAEVKAGATSISGTSQEIEGTVITLYKNPGGVLLGTATVQANGTWTVNPLLAAVAANETVYATATAPDKSVSANSNSITVGATVTCYLAPPTLATISNGSTSADVTWTWPVGTTPTVSTAQVKVYKLTANAEPPAVGSFINNLTTQYYPASNGTIFTYAFGASGNAAGTYVATITVGSCVSAYSNVIVAGNNNGVVTATPTITTPTTISQSSATQIITIRNNHSSTAKIILYVNGVKVAETAAGAVAANATTNLTLPAVNAGDIVSARAIGSAALQGGDMISLISTTITVVESTTQSAIPVISGSYAASNTSVNGTSTEAEGTTITLYKAGTTLIGTTTVTSQGTWNITGLTLVASDQLTAKAKASGKLISDASVAKTVAAIPATPAITGSYFSGATSVSGTGTSGQIITLYVDGSPVYDGSGNPITTTVSGGGTWTISSLSASTLYRGALLTASSNNGISESTTSGSVTVTGVSSFLITNISNIALGTQTAGTPFNIKVLAKDGAAGLGSTVATFTGKVVISSSSVLTAGGTPNAFALGELATHAVTLITAGAGKTLTVVSEDDPTATGTATFTINAGAVAKLLVSKPANVNTTDRAAYTISRADAYDNLVSTGGGITVTLGSTVNGLFYNAANAGSTISSVDIASNTSTANAWFGSTTTGSYNLTFTSVPLTEGKDTIVVFGVATKFIVTLPTTARTSSTIAVSAQYADASNNAVTTAGLTVTWGTTNGGTFSAPTSTTNASGVATINFTTSASSGVSHLVSATSVVTGNATVTTSNSFVWVGTSNTNASTTTNWQNSAKPTANDNVIILATATNSPVLVENTTFGSLTIESGKRIDLNGSKLTISGTVSGTGVFRGSTTSTLELGAGATGTLLFDQTEDATRTSNMLGSIILQNTGSVTLGNKVLVKGAIDLTSGAGSVVSNGMLVIASDADGTGYVTGDLTRITGNVVAERFISSNILGSSVALNRAWRLLAPIVTTATAIREHWQEGVNNLLTGVENNLNPNAGYGTHITGSTTGLNGFDATISGSPSLYTYNTGTQSWVTVGNTNATNLSPTTGYLIFIRGDRSMNVNTTALSQGAANTRLRATGPLVTSNQSFPVPTTVGQYAVVTNPFAAPINWATVIADGDNSGSFENTYTTWDPNQGQRGVFVTVNAAGLASGGSSTNNIQSGLAFLVRRTSGTGNFSIKTAHRTTTNTIDIFRSGTQQEKFRAGLFFINTEDNTRRQADGVLIVHDNQYSPAFDGNDAEQIPNWDEDIAIDRNGKMLSIETRPLADAGDTVFLSVARLREMPYEWEFKAEHFNAPGLTAFLQDNYSNTETAISLTGTTVVAFVVNSDAASKAAERFRIVYRSNNVLPVTLTNAKAYKINEGIKVEWNTQHESGITSYHVEKSVDGNTFMKMNDQSSKLQITNTYNWTDLFPSKGTNYYRIKINHSNRSATYSAIMKVSLDAPNKIQLYPNPAIDADINLQLENLKSGKYSVTIYNQAGQQVKQQLIDHSGTSAIYTINVASLNKGVYHVKISNGEINYSEKFIKP